MTATVAPLSEALSASAQLIRDYDRLAVLAHVNPDADAIGAMLGLTLGLRSMGKHAQPLLNDPVPEYSKFLKGAGDIRHSFAPGSFDALVFLDSAGIDRVGDLYSEHQKEIESLPVLNIDHHRTNPLFGTVNYVDGEASSTSELVHRVLCVLEASVDKDAATALLFGIVGDTGSFRNGATTPSSLQVAGTLLGLGADVQLVAYQLFEAKTFPSVRLWADIVGTAELERKRRIVVAYMTQKMLVSSGATADEVEGVAEYLRGVEEAETVMLLKENPDGSFRVSFRSRPNVDVSIIASDLGGGGHRQAAGCTVPGPMSAARQLLINTYDKFYPS